MTKTTTSARKILATKTSQLKVILTEAEKKEVAEKLAQAEGDLRDHVAKTKDIASDLKAKKESIDSALRSLGQIARNGYDYRPIPVRVEADFRAGRVYEIREDTGEVVTERPVNEGDRQDSLFSGGPRADPFAPLVGSREDAEKRHREGLETEADTILTNAGAGALNDKALKGEAAASKGPRR